LRGASAVESILRAFPDPELRVFVVWEPVLLSDWHAPGADAVARITDSRAAQFWDARHRLSTEIRRAGEANPTGVLGDHRLHGTIVWDFVALYTPGIRWDAAFPPARFAGAPVVRVADDLCRALAANSLQSFTQPTNALYRRPLLWN